LSNSSVG